jgi:transcriptional regulator with XRE-family HTH domain
MLRLVEMGRRLLEERKRLALNQEALGAKANVSRAAQATYESGKTPPDIIYMALVGEAGVDVGYVLSGRRGPEVGGDLLDWTLAGQLLAGIEDFAQDEGILIPADKKIALLRVLYRQAAREQRVDAEMLRDMIRLAA